MCRSGCPTQDHKSYADCLRGANVRVAYCGTANGLDFSTQKRSDKELSRYRELRAVGMQPDGTTNRAMDKAERLSDAAGVAYVA